MLIPIKALSPLLIHEILKALLFIQGFYHLTIYRYGLKGKKKNGVSKKKGGLTAKDHRIQLIKRGSSGG